MADIRECLERDAFAKLLGIELVEVSPGRAVARMAVRDEHFNSFGLVHGGAVFSLADFAFAAACNSHGTVAVALSASIAFARAAGKGTLTAEGREIAASRKVGTYEILVKDEAGETVAIFQGTAYRKGDPLPGLS